VGLATSFNQRAYVFVFADYGDRVLRFRLGDVAPATRSASSSPAFTCAQPSRDVLSCREETSRGTRWNLAFHEKGFVEERYSPTGVKGTRYFLRVAEEDGLDAEDFFLDQEGDEEEEDGHYVDNYSGDGDDFLHSEGGERYLRWI